MSPISVKFVAVGVVNTLVGVTTIYLTKWLLGLGDIVANSQ
jgi:putative flippase GtrA